MSKWLRLIEGNWDDIGACDSCGWHDLFSNYDIDNYDIDNALTDGGDMELLCHSDDDENASSHRGIRFNLYHLEPPKPDKLKEYK